MSRLPHSFPIYKQDQIRQNNGRKDPIYNINIKNNLGTNLRNVQTQIKKKILIILRT